MPRCDWWKPNQTFACQSPTGNYGQLQMIGCQVGCIPCDALADGTWMGKIGVNSYGLRSMKPDQGAESRNARGALAKIVSNQPTRLPRGRSHFVLAPCWDNLGREYYHLQLCDCRDQICQDGDEARPAFYRYDKKVTCQWFTGVHWPPDRMECTSKRYGHTRMVVVMRGTNFGQGAFARTSENKLLLTQNHLNTSWCTSNFMILCRGEVEEREPCIPENPWTRDHYAENWTLWEHAHILNIGAGFVDHPAAPDSHRAAVAAKNAVMAFVESDRQHGYSGLLHFDQMDAYPSNTGIDAWTRGRNLLDDFGWDALPVVMPLPGSHLVGSGHPVIAEYVLVNASFWMSLVIHRIKDHDPLVISPPGSRHERHLPMVRMTLDLTMGVRVRFPGDGPYYLDRTWNDPPDQIELHLKNQYRRSFPRVFPEPLDRIRYVDAQGRAFSPPPRVTWKGHLGFFSDPPTSDTFDWDYDETPGIPHEAAGKCCALARAMDGLEVPAFMSHPETSDTRRIWAGSVRLRFPFEGHCPEP